MPKRIVTKCKVVATRSSQPYPGGESYPMEYGLRIQFAGFDFVHDLLEKSEEKAKEKAKRVNAAMAKWRNS